MGEVKKQPAVPEIAIPDDDEKFLFQMYRGLYGDNLDRVVNFQETDEKGWQNDKHMWEMVLTSASFRKKAQHFIETAPPESQLKTRLANLLPTIKEFFTHSSVVDVLSRLYPPEIAKKIGPTLEDWGKQIEESLRSDPNFEKKIQQMIDDPKLFDDPALSSDIKKWLKARINAAVLTSVGVARTERVGMLQSLRSSQNPSPQGVNPSAPSELPAQAPSTLPVSISTITPLGQPTQPAGQPNQPPKTTAAATAKETTAEFQSNLQKEAKASGTFELLGKAMSSLAGLLEGLKGWDPLKAIGLGGKNTTEPEKKKSSGEKYTEEQLKQMALDLAKNKDKVYPSQDKAVEYIATALNLPLRETAQKFLDSLTDSGMVFDQSMDNMKNLETGDVLFFKKTNEQGESFAYTCGVISSKEPLKMRIVPDGGGAPQEISVTESDYFKNSWYGFVKTKNYAHESKP
jgi:hypothetical protein